MNLFTESAHLLFNGSKGQAIFRLIIYKVYASLSLIQLVVYNIRKSDILWNIKKPMSILFLIWWINEPGPGAKNNGLSSSGNHFRPGLLRDLYGYFAAMM